MMRPPPSLLAALTLVSIAILVSNVSTIPSAFAQALPGGSTTSTGANIRATRHNLSPSAPSRPTTSQNSTLPTTEPVVKGTSTTEVCIYCHTPHGAETIDAPLWNRALSGATYTPYSSSSLQAQATLDVGNLGTPSKLCLSCHDGTLALGAVSNAPGSAGSPLSLSDTASGGTMPFGRGQTDAEHGFTRRLGTDLRNDHPIAFTYDASLAVADGELRSPAGSSSPTLIADRVLGQPAKPDFPLTGGQVQCSTCHEPHRNTQKFLLKNRLAQDGGAPGNAPQNRQSIWSGWSFDDRYDQICLGCHTRLGKAWGQSAHANSAVSAIAPHTYLTAAAVMRDFPTDPTVPGGTKVWQAGCLNCHDTHTVAGSRRLLREGVNTSLTGDLRPGVADGSDYATSSAIENTCYQCHSGSSVVTSTIPMTAQEGLPNIQNEFARDFRMPITNADQSGNSAEVHDISDADGMEAQTLIGYGTPENRHVECTDCHNPHRVLKANTFIGQSGTISYRTHTPAFGANGEHGNIASGALRGAWGVEPSYTAVGQSTVTTSTRWLNIVENPTFTVKKGDPGNATSLPVGTAGTNSVSYLTREYQLCFKCHSSYANGPLASDFPLLGRVGGSSFPNEFDLDRYTNVAAEYAVIATDPPTTGTHQGEETNGGAGSPCVTGDCDPVNETWDTQTGSPARNHRSWHPVVFPTGRNGVERGSAAFDSMRPPFNVAGNIGKQTMHCSDCHGAATSWSDGSGPNLSQVQGPHGSDNIFLLKGTWSGNTSNGASDRMNRPNGFPGSLCQNCHNQPSTLTNSGFAGDHVPDGNMAGLRCMSCHIAIPHGWKNKAFLANLRCVGREAGAARDTPAGTETEDCVDMTSWGGGLTAPPYYNTAYMSISTWQVSGAWSSSSLTQCGGDSMKNCADGD